MGILIEADYKGVLQGKESIVSGLQKAFSKTKKGSANPLERKDGEDLEPLEAGGQLTYELMNRDTGKLQDCPGHNGVTDVIERSNCSSQRIHRVLRPVFPLHIGSRRRTCPTTAIHQLETRRRSHNRIKLSFDAKHLPSTRHAIRFV